MTNVEWSAFIENPGTDKPVLLNPLSWKNGNQVSNLIAMIKFFQEHELDEKTKILIYKSCCGSGKSITILHVPKELDGRAIIVTPFRNLQMQYYNDYFKGNKFVMKKDGTKLGVSVFMGRNNFKCRFLEEQYEYQQKIIETNEKFGQSIPIDDNILKSYQIDNTAANRYLPCTKMLELIGAGRRMSRHVAASTCLHPDMDILTPKGIKKIKDVNVGDSIYSENIDNMKVEIDTIKNIRKSSASTLFRFYNKGKMGCDLSATPDHIMIYKRNSSSKPVYCSPAEELLPSLNNNVCFIKPFDIPHIHEYRKDIDINGRKFCMNDFLTLLGWYISEGSIHDIYKEKYHYRYCCISQYFWTRLCDDEHNEHAAEIGDLLDRMNLQYSYDEKVYVISDEDMSSALMFYGGRYSHDKFIHKDIFDLPKEQLKYLFKSLIKGDGCNMNGYHDSYRYSTVSMNLSNDIIWLANILGYRTYRTFVHPSINSDSYGSNGVYIINIGQSSMYTKFIDVDILKYGGDVYDIEVEKNHNYFAGNNGKFVLVHNCQYWVPPPMTKEIISKWANTFDGDIDRAYDNYDKSYNDGHNIDDGVNEQQTRDNMQAIDGTPSSLDKIKDKVKCSNIEYYESVGSGQMGVFIRDEKDKHGKPCPDVCPYYKQFYSYVHSDVIVFNSAKWNLETTMGRKPKVKVEIIDEGDYWLDSQATTIELMRSTIDKMFPVSNRMKHIKSDTLARFDLSFKKIKTDVAKANAGDVNIISAKDYKELFYSIGVCLNEYKKQAEDDDAIEQKLVDIDTIRHYADVASLSVVEGKREETRVIKCYIPYPDKLLESLFKSSSKNIILTSGTMHANSVLSSLFGINADNYSVDVLNGRKEHPGKLKCIRPQKDSPMSMVKVNYTSWQSPEFRAYYYLVLNYILDQLKDGIDKATGKPGEAKILVLTPAKKYAEGILKRPDVFVDFAKGRNKDDEDVKPAIDTNITDYMEGTLTDIRKIKSTDIELNGDVLRTNKQIIVSTRMVRGTDLRDDKCRAIVMTKWPVGDISDGYLQSVKKRFGEKVFWEIIRDKAAREAVQYVSRGLRHDLDWCYFSTVDQTAFDNVFRLFSYD